MEKIRDKLIEYRLEKSNKSEIPLDYIFTDEELNLLINNKFQNISELDFLSDIKMKLHGKEIINIINKNKEN